LDAMPQQRKQSEYFAGIHGVMNPSWMKA
jgi:hypothetical protein